ncbi:MAG: CSLREA domain-containing protein, partial [Gemmataceae bacterium]|nr:CSLREA domain-containing protein [Gemmataceae bacterium]
MFARIWRWWFQRYWQARRAGVPRRRTRPRWGVEGREARSTPAVFTVTTTADTVGGPLLSLRDAITAVNLSGDPVDTIILPAGTYSLTRNGSDDNNLYGDLDLHKLSGTVNIVGAGASSTI